MSLYSNNRSGVNASYVKVFDDNAIYIGDNEVPISNGFRDFFSKHLPSK